MAGRAMASAPRGPKLPSVPSEGDKFTLEVLGHVPAKKNLWKQRRGGGQFLDTETKAMIQALTDQMVDQWKDAKYQKRPPLKWAHVDVILCVKDLKGDADNKYTTLQDCLVKAGVLVGDTMARVPDFHVSIIAGVAEEKATIRLFGKLGKIREAFGL